MYKLYMYTYVHVHTCMCTCTCIIKLFDKHYIKDKKYLINYWARPQFTCTLTYKCSCTNCACTHMYMYICVHAHVPSNYLISVT